MGFFSKKLEKAQTNYSALDRELLVCVSGIRHFRFMLEGRPFRIYTDHKPLTYALSRSSEPWTARQCRHLSYVAEFFSDIRHINSKDNLVADTMSRPPAGAATLIGPSLAVVRPASIKEPSGSLAATTAAGTGPTAGQNSQQVDFAAMAAHQADCIKTQCATTSSSLKVQSIPL